VLVLLALTASCVVVRLRETLDGVQVFDGAEPLAPWKFVPSAKPKRRL
jgi:hypothetical protein